MSHLTERKSYAEIFETSGAFYHAAMELCPEARDAEFQAAVSHLDINPGNMVLDVPAGGGYLKGYLPEGVDYQGFDFAGDFGGHAGDEESNRIRRCSETAFPLEDQSVDRVICIAALHHINDRLGFYRECARVLRDDGRLIIADVIEGSPQDEFLNVFVDRWSARGHDGEFLNPFRDKAEATSSGFEMETSTEEYAWRFPSKEIAMQYCRLLFCLNEDPTDAELEEGLASLNFRSSESASCLDWKLGFLELRKRIDLTSSGLSAQ